MIRLSIKLVLLPATALCCAAADWPCHMGNNQRSGITTEQLTAASLTEAWVWNSPAPPQPAWGAEARYDAYALVHANKSMRAYDLAFNLSAAGGMVFVASTAENCVIALDAATGNVAWRAITRSAVRIAPGVASNKVYFGSDDGWAYCVNQADGTVVWKVNPSATAKMIPSSWKMINLYPVRTGVLVEAGKAYFGAGLMPWKEQYLMAVDAAAGTQLWKQTFNTGAGATDGHTFEGPLMSNGSTFLYQPQGRLSPVAFNTADGTRAGRLPGGGGSWALVTPDGSTIHGPGFGSQSGIISNRWSNFKEDNATTRAAIREYPAATAIIATAAELYMLIDRKVQKLPRAGGTATWTADLPGAATMILGGTTLYAGGDGVVGAFNTSNGTLLWTAPVKGQVGALALANGALFVSTTAGRIHAFR